jgi:hypothetical protein
MKTEYMISDKIENQVDNALQAYHDALKDGRKERKYE